MPKWAAELKVRCPWDFVDRFTGDAAQRAIEGRIIRLSADDQRCIAESLINPPSRNAALKRARRLYLANIEAR